MVIVKRAIADLPAEQLAELEAVALWRTRDGRLAFDKRDPRYVELCAPPRHSSKSPHRSGKPELGECALRGNVIGEGDCVTCTGRVVVKVFACQKHGKCCIKNTTHGVRSCATCPDHRPAPSPAPSTETP